MTSFIVLIRTKQKKSFCLSKPAATPHKGLTTLFVSAQKIQSTEPQIIISLYFTMILFVSVTVLPTGLCALFHFSFSIEMSKINILLLYHVIQMFWWKSAKSLSGHLGFAGNLDFFLTFCVTGSPPLRTPFYVKTSFPVRVSWKRKERQKWFMTNA